MSDDANLPVTFFEGFDGALRRLVLGACELADRKGIPPMRWLVRMVTPPGGVVLDPFAGTGTRRNIAPTSPSAWGCCSDRNASAVWRRCGLSRPIMGRCLLNPSAWMAGTSPAMTALLFRGGGVSFTGDSRGTDNRTDRNEAIA